MSCRGLYIFKHAGTDSDPEQRKRQAMLGCAPAHKLLDLGEVISIEKNVDTPRCFGNYTVSVNCDKLRTGVELIEK